MRIATRGEDLAWAAGFLDGEGSFMFQIRSDDRGRGRLIAQAAQADIRPLQRLQAILGGKINGPYRILDHRPYWMWQARGEEHTLGVFAALMPYLTAPKQEPAVRALAAREAHHLVRPLRKSGPKKGSPWRGGLWQHGDPRLTPTHPGDGP